MRYVAASMQQGLIWTKKKMISTDSNMPLRSVILENYYDNSDFTIICY